MNKPQKRPELSIVILNHNTSDLLRQCLASLPKSPPYQVIVVDADSNDDSVAMVRKEFPRVELILSATNPGYTKGNNLARVKASGRYVLFLNSDTEVYPHTLETMIAYMNNDSQIGVATCLTILPNGQLYYACHRGFPTPWNSLCYFTGLARLFPKSELFAGYTATYLPLNEIHEIDACSGTFLMIRKDLLDKLGWFDENFFSYGEDLDLCFRVKELGYKVMFNPTVKILHHWGASSGLKSTSKPVAQADTENRSRWNQARYEAMKIFYDKHYRKNYPEFFRYVIHFGISVFNYLRRGRD